MNYKVLAVSVAATAAVIAFSLREANSPAGDRVSAHSAPQYTTSLDITERPSGAPIPHAMVRPENRELLAANQAAQALSEPARSTDASLSQLSEGSLPSLGPINLPQIAYQFGYTFGVPANAIKPLLDRHVEQCESKGISVCQIISMEQSENGEDYAQGSLQLAVAAKDARAFGKELTRSAINAEGELVSSSIDGEDLSRQIVDTEARLRARTVLRDRLMEILKNRRGTVAELVEAERGVAQVNEEIDQATSWLTEMKGRVQFSKLHISYQASSANAAADDAADDSSWKVLAILLFLTAIGIALAYRRWPEAWQKWLANAPKMTGQPA